MFDWLNSFLDERFMPHGHCYLWRPDILWTHVIADATIALSYYAIPIVLGIIFFKKRKELIFNDVLLLFIAFIFLCGTTHLVSIYVTWHPLYEQQGWLKAVTALVSALTAFVLIPRLSALISMPGVQRAYDESQENLKKVELEKEEMESMFAVLTNREKRVLELKLEVNELLKAQGIEPKYKVN